jgi:argininosuccinate synthase
MTSALRSIDPALEPIVPIRDWQVSPEEMIDYAKQQGIPTPSSVADYDVDANFWARSLTSRDRDDPWAQIPEEMYVLTKAASDAPEVPAVVEIEFESGTPIKINGVPMPFAELIQSLATIAGAHGVGRVEFVEPDVAGSPRRRILEAPAAVTLQTALRELQAFMTPRDLHGLSAEMAAKYISLVLEGAWFSPARHALDAFVAKATTPVTGTVRLKLDKGVCQVAEVQPARVPAVQEPTMQAPPS